MVALLAETFTAKSQPIMPVAVLGSDTNADVEFRLATLQWDKHPNALIYRWTNWNATTNQGGWTTATNTQIVVVLGTNRSAVRAEAASNVSSWSWISVFAEATSTVTLLDEKMTRWQISPSNAWTGWVLFTNQLPHTMAATNFRQEFKLNLKKNDGWNLKQ